MEEMSIDQLIDKLETHKKYITDEQNLRLRGVTSGNRSGDETMSDLLKEVQAQMTYLKKFRQQIEQKGSTATTREVKDMIQASISLFSMLTRMNDDINNQDRLRKIENATVEVVRTLSQESQQQFFSLLEEALAR